MSNPHIIPEHSQRGRPFPTTTRIGRVMRLRGWQEVYKFAAAVEISPRQMTEYLSGRDVPSMEHLIRIADELDVDDPMLLREPTDQPNQTKKEETNDPDC